MQPVISVIVPVYKVEKYLDRCIESIVNQTYKNLEIILVDDGSPDNCPQMCDEWAKKDSRIKVIHKQNGGYHQQEIPVLTLQQVIILALLTVMIGSKMICMNTCCNLYKNIMRKFHV